LIDFIDMRDNKIKYIKIDIDYEAEYGNSPLTCTIKGSELGKGYNVCKGFIPKYGFDLSNTTQMYLSKNVRTYMNVYAIG